MLDPFFGCITLDGFGVVSECDCAAGQLIGGTSRHVPGRPFRTFVTESDLPIFDRFLAHSLSGSFPPACRLTLIRDDGTERAVRLEAATLWGGRDFRAILVDLGGAYAIPPAQSALDRLGPAAQLRLLDKCLSRVNDIVLVTDADTPNEPGPRIIYVNEAFERRTGYARDEVIGRSPRFLQGPATDPHELRKIGAALRSRQPVRTEIINYKKNGDPFWLEMDIVPVEDVAGRVTQWVSVARDVTERKQTEVSLREAQERLRFALDAAQIGDWNMDLRTNVAIRSLQHDRCFGYSEPVAEWGYETFLSHVLEVDRERVDTAYRNALAGAGEYDVEFRVLWPDQSLHWLWSKGRFFFDAYGLPYRVSGIQADVTIRRHDEEVRRENAARLELATEALRASERRFRGVIEASPLPYALNDDRQNITFLNPAFVRTFGYTLADIPTLECWWRLAYPDPEYRDWVAATWRQRVDAADRSKQNFEPMDVTVRCKDGSSRWVIAQAAPLATAFDSTHLVILIDVTEARQVEQRIIEATTREQHRLGLDLHDGLGQELTGLSMMLIALSRRVATRGDFAIESELASLAALASRCVQTARSIAHGLSPVELASAGLGDSLRRLVAATRTIGGANIRLSLNGLEHHAVSPGITEAMYRIVQEAIANALKHAGATQISVDADLTGDHLTVAVTDNGCGIRADEFTDGIGLSIMRYRARALGGRLTVTAPAAGGTIVRCTCPLRFVNRAR